MPGEHTKRDFIRYHDSHKNLVEKKYKEKHIISWGGDALINSKGEFEGVNSFGPPNTPINKYLNSPEVLEGLKKAAEETYYGMFDEQDPIAEPPIEEVPKENVEIKMPPRPVMDLSHAEMQSYFGPLIKSVYDKEGLTIVNKWARIKKTTGETIPPTPPCPFWNSGILDEKYFFGN